MRNPTVYIYKLECLENGRVYVGKTLNPERREKDHFYALKNGYHTNELMQADFDLYGVKAFRFTVVGTTTRTHNGRNFQNNKLHFADSMMEKAFMEFYHSDSKEYGYNYKDNYFHPLWMRKAEKRKKNAS